MKTLLTSAWLFLRAQNWRMILTTGVISLLMIAATVLAAMKFGHLRFYRTTTTSPAPNNLPVTGPEFINTIGMKFARIEPGSFLMGAFNEPDRDEFDGPQHTVTLTKAFYLGIHHVTVRQFAKFVNDTGHTTDAEKAGGGFALQNDGSGYTFVKRAAWHHPGFTQTQDHPVIFISWNDATAFCKFLSAKEGRRYRLPSEAEWEYACRAGTTTLYPWGDKPEGGKGFTNVCDETFKARFTDWPDEVFHFTDGYFYTSPVGSFKPNAFGLYDMIGNAWQWCADADGAYSSAPVVNPAGPTPTVSSKRILRGGAFDSIPKLCRSCKRFPASPELHNANVGFRVALTP